MQFRIAWAVYAGKFGWKDGIGVLVSFLDTVFSTHLLGQAPSHTHKFVQILYIPHSVRSTRYPLSASTAAILLSSSTIRING
jgi:hypothetical protein